MSRGSDDPSPLNHLFALLYRDLWRMARRRLQAGAPITLLDAGALVHETYERLARLERLDLHSRGHFLAYAGRTMRSVIVDTVRQRTADRRGGGASALPLGSEAGDVLASAWADTGDALALRSALDALARLHPRRARIVQLRYFGGLTQGEVASALGLGLRTVERDWEHARSFLQARLRDEER
ncbi:MAG: sigma-70 family RNA polymerase sigma factor [Burkholderiales bacterium]|nr:sigma-70 family RNA polymerase sigma factor [Burkholderiales bacterium]